MVICLETSDPVRLEQLKSFFCNPSPEDYNNHTVYVYDPWNGLGRLDKLTKRLDLETATSETGVGKRFQQETGERIRDLAACLNVMDAKLRNDKTVLILHGLTQDQEGKNRLASALKAWANSGDLIQHRSLVILFGSVPTDLLDEETKDLVAD
jgi:hypothetical protein